MYEPIKIKVYKIVEPNLNKNVQSTTPSGAAKKVYSRYIRPEIKNQEIVKNYIIKIQNENGKLFEYDVHEVKKNDIVLRGNKQIPYTYNVIVKSKNIHKSENARRKKSESKSKSKSRSKSKSKSNTNKRFVWFSPIKKNKSI